MSPDIRPDIIRSHVTLWNDVRGTHPDVKSVRKLHSGKDLERLVKPEGTIPFESIASDAQQSQLFLEATERALETLTYRERRVLSLRFGLEDGRQKTFKEVGSIFAVSRNRIAQIVERAVRILRHPSRGKLIYPFLPPDSPRRF